MPIPKQRQASVAPMMDCTDRDNRFLLRLISKKVHLYTEMVTTHAILNGPRERLLSFSPEEHPIALQLGGSNAEDLAECTRMATDYGYDEINLNVGCPSDRVRNGRFGVCLMKEPETVARAISSMIAATHLPVTLKCRIGVDDQDSYQHLKNFIQQVADSGCEYVTLHARKAILGGLSPKQNRQIPPLKYEIVHQIKKDFPQLGIEINGGLKTINQCLEQLESVDSVMIGREAYSNPCFLNQVDSKIYGEEVKEKTRTNIIAEYIEYLKPRFAEGISLHIICKHLQGLYHGQAGAGAWRRLLDKVARQKDKPIEALEQALSFSQTPKIKDES